MHRGPHDSIVKDSLLFRHLNLVCSLLHLLLFRMAASTQCRLDAAVPNVIFLHHQKLVCFIDVILGFILSLIVHRFLIKFRLLLRRKLVRVCCQLPSCSVVPLPPSSFSPHFFQLPTLFETSLSPPVLSSTRKGLGVDSFLLSVLPSGFVVAFGSLFGVVSTLLMATDSFTVSDFESLQSSSRSSMLFLPAVGYAFVLLGVGYALVLLAVGYALSVLLIFPLLLGMLFLRSSYPCCFLPSSHHWLFGCGSVSDSTFVNFFSSLALLAVILSLFAVFWYRFLQHHFAAVYDSVVRFRHLQHHFPALSHFVIVVSR